jgi:hypothetical protein
VVVAVDALEAKGEMKMGLLVQIRGLVKTAVDASRSGAHSALHSRAMIEGNKAVVRTEEVQRNKVVDHRMERSGNNDLRERLHARILNEILPIKKMGNVSSVEMGRSIILIDNHPAF